MKQRTRVSASMKRSIFVTAVLIMALSCQKAGIAQQTPSRSAEAVEAKSAPPEWYVWRAFHDSLEFYARQNPASVGELLEYKLTLNEMQQAAFMANGRNYLQRTDEIYRQARADIFRRYGERFIPRSLPPAATRVEELVRGPVEGPVLTVGSPALVPGQVDDGQSLWTILEATGFVAEVQAKRDAAVQAHTDVLRASLGKEVFAKLEAWIAADVAPNVSVDTEERAPRVFDDAPQPPASGPR